VIEAHLSVDAAVEHVAVGQFRPRHDVARVDELLQVVFPHIRGRLVAELDAFVEVPLEVRGQANLRQRRRKNAPCAAGVVSGIFHRPQHGLGVLDRPTLREGAQEKRVCFAERRDPQQLRVPDGVDRPNHVIVVHVRHGDTVVHSGVVEDTVFLGARHNIVDGPDAFEVRVARRRELILRSRGIVPSQSQYRFDCLLSQLRHDTRAVPAVDVSIPILVRVVICSVIVHVEVPRDGYALYCFGAPARLVHSHSAEIDNVTLEIHINRLDHHPITRCDGHDWARGLERRELHAVTRPARAVRRGRGPVAFTVHACRLRGFIALPERAALFQPACGLLQPQILVEDCPVARGDRIVISVTASPTVHLQIISIVAVDIRERRVVTARSTKELLVAEELLVAIDWI